MVVRPRIACSDSITRESRSIHRAGNAESNCEPVCRRHRRVRHSQMFCSRRWPSTITLLRWRKKPWVRGVGLETGWLTIRGLPPAVSL